MTTATLPVPPRSRARLVGAAVVVLAVGLGVSRADGLAADLAGGALYAALVQLLVLLVAPRAHPRAAAAVALGACVAVELAQLTGVPADVVAAWPPAAYVLGSTFAPLDLLAYAAGVAVVTVVDARARRAARVRQGAAADAA